MKKILGSAVALTLPALMAVAISPVEETPASIKGALKMQRVPSLIGVQPATSGTNAFFEGFEGRPEGITMAAREWLPTGWQDVSKAGHSSSDEGHNLTWQVLDEDSKQTIGPTVLCNPYEGYSFAYIMADVAYGDHTDLAVQDEWLITPSVTPSAEDWFYFKLWFNPGWTLYNRTANDFTGQNNSLEVYLSTDDGATWTKAWSLIDDYIKDRYSDDQLRASLIDTEGSYSSIYVNVHDYVGTPLKFAFRYFGNLGLPMAIDNVAMGVPTPDASYQNSYAVWRQGLSPNVDYPVDPKLYIPYNTEIEWVNTSREFLNNEWVYAAADGSVAKSTLKNLTTPAYEFGSLVATPTLTSFFESAQTQPYREGFATMQAGGIFTGKDIGGYEGEFGVCFPDLTEQGHSIRLLSEYVGFNPEIDLAWEKIQGVPDGTMDVVAICNMYFYGGVPYGFDYIDVPVLIKETFDADARIIARVFAIDDAGAISGEIGTTVLYGKDMPEANPQAYTNLRFKFDVPVYVNTNILVFLTNPCRNEKAENVYNGNIAFPFVKSPSKLGNTLMYVWTSGELGESEVFLNLNEFPLEGGNFGGILMNLGVSYSDMELVDGNAITMPAEGGTATVKVKAHHAPERWALTFDGINRAKGLSHTAVYDDASQTYTVTLTADKNEAEAIKDGKLFIVSPGSVVGVDYNQESGIDGIVADSAAAQVTVAGNTIIADGVLSYVKVFNAAGQLVAQAPANGGRATIDASHLTKGVYIVTVDGSKATKIVK